MNGLNPTLNWAHLKSFADVCEYGSVSAAARETGSSQPTISRHISLLEQQFGARLFDRDISGMMLTTSGEHLLEKVAVMSQTALQISPSDDETSPHLTGSVRITASNIIAMYALPKVLANLRDDEPNLEIEVVSSDTTENLLRREADIAVRMYQPKSGDLYCRKIGDVQIHMYGSKEYIKNFGQPTNAAELLEHSLIGYDRSTRLIEGFNRAGVNIERSAFKFRSDNQVLCWQMVCDGYGLGFNGAFVGDVDDRLDRINLPGAEGNEEVWLIAHKELKSSSRVRRVFDFLAEQMPSVLNP